MSDESDYQEYLDYQEYQKHMAASAPVAAQPAAPEQSLLQKGSAMLGKGMDAVEHFPTNVIDQIPGMKDRRQQIEQTRQSPEFAQQFEAEHGKPYIEPVEPGNGAMDFVGPKPVYGMAKTMGKVAGGLKDFFSGGARRAEVMEHVKDVSKLEPYVQGKISEAAEMFNKKQIGPRMLEQESRIKDAVISMDPSKISGLSPEIDAMIAQLPKSGNGMVQVPGKDALALRAEINKVSGWKANPMDATKARAVDEAAGAAHSDLAGQFSSHDPAMEPLSKELQEAYTTQKQAIGNAGKNPINAVIQNDGVAGLTKKGRLQRFDDQAGSQLGQLGKDIKTANDRSRPMALTDLFTIHGPKQAATKLTAPALNAYDKTAAKLSPYMNDVEQMAKEANESTALSPAYMMQLTKALQSRKKHE